MVDSPGLVQEHRVRRVKTAVVVQVVHDDLEIILRQIRPQIG